MNWLLKFYRSIFAKAPVQVNTLPGIAPINETTNVWFPPSFSMVGKTPRHLEDELEQRIDRWLVENRPAFRGAILTGDANLIKHMANEALLAFKVREATNSNDGHDVELIQETIGKAEREPWCMAQQQTTVAYAEKKTGKVSSLFASESVMAVVDNTSKVCRVDVFNSQPGDLWCWQHGTSYKGHVGDFSSWIIRGHDAYIIEGNTNARTLKGGIVREGGGTFMNERSVNPVGDMRLVAVIRPFV